MSPTELLFINVLIGVVIPLVVALVTAQVSSPKVKSTALLVLSGIAGYLSTLLVADVAVNWKTVGVTILTIIVAAVASFFGFTSPWGLAGSDGAIQKRVPGGFGKAA
jgi:hypothetical protein